MLAKFKDGTDQSIIERVMALGLNLGDIGAIDISAFQTMAYDLAELMAVNFRGA